MTLLQRILLIPSLLPLVAVLVLSALHRGTPTRLHLLGWSSPEAPLGFWTAFAATGAAALSASSALLLVVPSNQPLRRRLHRPLEAPPTPEWQVDSVKDRSPASSQPQRDLRDPAPTVAVAYRIIKRGVPHEDYKPAEREEIDHSFREPVPSQVSNASSPESGEYVASDWGDDPNRDW